MAMTIQEVAALVKSAKSSTKGNYIMPGHGTLVVSEWVYKADAFGGPTVICEFKVEKSESVPGCVDPETGKTVLANAPGTTCSFVKCIAPGKNQEFFLGQVKSLLVTLEGEDVDVGESLMHACKPEQPARGLRINYEANFAKTSKGAPVTQVRWFSYPNTIESKASGLAILSGV